MLLLFTEFIHDTPVWLMNCKPFAISRTDVNVHRAEVVIFLMTWMWETAFSPLIHIESLDKHRKMHVHANELNWTWCPAAWDLHIELDCVHSENGVTHMTEQIPCRHHPRKRRQLTQLSQLQLPPARATGQKGQMQWPDISSCSIRALLYFCSEQVSPAYSEDSDLNTQTVELWTHYETASFWRDIMLKNKATKPQVTMRKYY